MARRQRSVDNEGGRTHVRTTMGNLTSVSDQDFDAVVLDSDRPVLVDFWADWCNPCKIVEPHLEAIASEEPQRLRIVKLNLDENPRTADRFGVMSIPTMLLFVDGVETARLVGARPKGAIMAELESHLSAAGKSQAS